MAPSGRTADLDEIVTSFEPQRRPSYGPTSPSVGSRGARTRSQIVEAALECFTTDGFYATSVDDIASRAETSRATLYQYFESKESIFIELMVESGTALGRAVRHIGPLGPDANGYASLCRWLGESCRIYDTYAPMFIEWAHVNTSGGSLQRQVAEYVDYHIENFAAALSELVPDEEERRVDAIVTLAMFNRYNYIRHVYRPGLTDAKLFDSLACAFQKFLFPTTPDRVLAAGLRRDEGGDINRPPVTRIGPLAALQSRESIESADPFQGLSAQSTATVRQLLDAAGRVFAANGYNATNIDQIVSEAKLARGTFYRYFDNKTQVMAVLSREAAAVICPMLEEFEGFASGRDATQLRDWLRRFLAVQRTYAGVMRSWTEGLPIDPELLVGAADTVAALSKAIEATFGPTRVYPIDRRAGGMLMSSLLENVPNQSANARRPPTDDDIIEAQARFIERVIFPATT
jgi:AcrR family transcriptional regulator